MYTYYLFFFLLWQCCLFEFPNLVVILKCSRRFINFIPHLVADPSYTFMLVLMTLVFKRNPFVLQTQTSPPSPTQTFSLFPFLHCVLLLKHPHQFTPINRCSMTLVKGQISSRRKGKEVVSDPSAARNVGEEAVYSELDHSDEEEARHALDSECSPLIDL